MSAQIPQRGSHGFDDLFWEQLARLESRHQQIQTKHGILRHDLESVTGQDSIGLRNAWKHYCEVIGELERVAAEFESLRVRAG